MTIHYYPRLRVNESICRRHIATMAQKAAQSFVAFRPHFKSHQSGTLSGWFRDEGVSAITVSSLKMADYFAQHGWSDIFIAFPHCPQDTGQVNTLAGTIKLGVSVDSGATAKILADQIRNPLDIYLKIDTGYHRSGLDPDDLKTIQAIISIIGTSPVLTFRGFYTHDGHTYHTRSAAEVRAIAVQTAGILQKLKARFRSEHPHLLISVGDTPSCSLLKTFEKVDEVRPGNFVFYDLMQVALGVCRVEDVAVALECPVVSKNRHRHQLVIHGGAIHLSKESLQHEGKSIYGLIVPMHATGWGELLADTYLTSLSQEHGIIQTDEKTWNTFQVGDTLGILPVHSCLTANLASCYYDLGDQVLAKMQG